jgi:hypothetical protein
MALPVQAQFQIKQYGLSGDGSGITGAVIGTVTTAYALILRVLGTSEASVKNVWLGDYDTVAHAKHAAVAFFATPNIDATDTYWDTLAATSTAWDAAATPALRVGAHDILSTVFTPTYAIS